MVLTADDIDRLRDAGETFEVEFKGEERAALSDPELLEAIVCLANGRGGTLLVGVEDDGRITGARPRHPAGTDVRRVEAYVSNNTRPSLGVEAELIAHPSGEVLAVVVPKASVPTGTSSGRYVRRAVVGKGVPGCVPYFVFEMPAATATGVSDPTAVVVPGAVWDDLDALEFERMRRFIRENPARGDASLVELPDVEIAKALGAVEANGTVSGIRRLALLLFGREESLRRLVPTQEVAWQVLEGTSVGENDIFRWPLFRVFDEMGARFRARNRSVEVVDLYRTEVPDYSEPGFREAVANGLVHRDYNVLGAIHVQWHSDSIRIDNPGGFPEGVRLDNLLVTPPRPRNPLLADAFKRAGVVERTGRGVETIFEGQLRYGRPAPSYAFSTEMSVSVVLPGGEANMRLAALVAAEGRAGRPLSVWDLLVVNHVQQHRSATTAELAALLQRDEAGARAVANRLVEAGFLEARGDGRGRSYHLAAALYRELGDAAGYVRARGFEPLQQEQMVLQYARAHGRITRAETAELCRITGPQATRLLARLAIRHPELIRVGERRGTHYVWKEGQP